MVVTGKVRAMVLEGPRQMVMHEFERPIIKDDDALLKVEMCGICGSDISIYNGKYINPFPIIMGHEILGHIEEIGEVAAERKGLKKGDRVVVETFFGCGFCEHCLKGHYTSCIQGLTFGTRISSNRPPHLWGAYSAYMYLPPRAMIHKVDPIIPNKAAVLTCAILGNSIRWLRTVGEVTIGSTVVIIGPGQQGLAGVIAAREAGASTIIVIGRGKADSRRLAMAKRLGASQVIDGEQENPIEAVRGITSGKLADVVMDVTGKEVGLATAIDLVGNRGTIIAPGLYGHNVKVPLNIDTLVKKEASIKGVLSHDNRAVKQALTIVESRRYPLEDLVTHVYPLEEAELAVRVAGGEIPNEYPIKTVIVPR